MELYLNLNSNAVELFFILLLIIIISKTGKNFPNIRSKEKRYFLKLITQFICQIMF